MARPTADDRLDQIELLLQELLAPLIEPRRRLRGPGRPQVLSAGLLWAGVLVCLLRGTARQLEVWRLLAITGLWNYDRVSVEADAVWVRLKRAGAGPMQQLFTHITDELAARTTGQPHLAPFATEVVAVDDTTLDQVRRLLPDPKTGTVTAQRVLPGKLTSLFDVRRQLFRAVLPTQAAHRNPKQPMDQVRELVPAGTLLLLDLGYFSFRLFDDLTDDGLWFVTKLRAGTTTEQRHVLAKRRGLHDSLVWVGTHRADQARYTMRRIAVTIAGKERVYLTNVLEPAQLSVAEVVELYARRWDIELAFKTLKRELGLGVLWSANWEVILIQVWSALIVAQIAQSIRLQVAERAGVDLFDVSLALLLRTLPQIVRRGEADVIGIIASFKPTKGGIIRPSTRAKPVVPQVRAVIPPPPDLPLQRMGRYAGRRCGPGRTDRRPAAVVTNGT